MGHGQFKKLLRGFCAVSNKVPGVPVMYKYSTADKSDHMIILDTLWSYSAYERTHRKISYTDAMELW